MVRAYVLVQTEIGRSAEVAAHVRELPGVERAESVTGPYDVIVQVSAADVVKLGRDVLAEVQSTPGISRTLTCPVVELA